MSRKSGLRHEAMAEKYLLRMGLKLVDKNYHTYRGEIDLIMQDQGTLVFVEVRFRQNSYFGSAAESVTSSKQHKLFSAAQRYLQQNSQYRENACRFDVIAITGSSDSREKPKIDWIKNAFLIT